MEPFLVMMLLGPRQSKYIEFKIDLTKKMSMRINSINFSAIIKNNVAGMYY